MAAGMDEVLRQAIEAAEQSFPEGVWDRLSPSERTAAIYREMHRLDAERARKHKPAETKPKASSKKAR